MECPNICWDLRSTVSKVIARTTVVVCLRQFPETPLYNVSSSYWDQRCTVTHVVAVTRDIEFFKYLLAPEKYSVSISCCDRKSTVFVVNWNIDLLCPNLLV